LIERSVTFWWGMDGEDFVLESSSRLLRRRGPRLGPSGIEAGLLRRKTWQWHAVSVVTWDIDANGLPCLALCLFGDPWVKALPLPWSQLPWWPPPPWEPDSPQGQVRALLEPIRPLVEKMGARVENRNEGATHWWHLHPDARRK
jgi:hypothetical protein